MTRHRWVALGEGRVTQEQAAQREPWFGSAGPGRMEVRFGEVICVVCTRGYEGADEACAGVPAGEQPDRHLWQAAYSHALTDEEAAAWADPDGVLEPGVPRLTRMTCLLCGASPFDEPHGCPERALWTAESSLDLDPEDLTDWAGGGYRGDDPFAVLADEVVQRLSALAEDGLSWLRERIGGGPGPAARSDAADADEGSWVRVLDDFFRRLGGAA